MPALQVIFTSFLSSVIHHSPLTFSPNLMIPLPPPLPDHFNPIIDKLIMSGVGDTFCNGPKGRCSVLGQIPWSSVSKTSLILKCP